MLHCSRWPPPVQGALFWLPPTAAQVASRHGESACLASHLSIGFMNKVPHPQPWNKKSRGNDDNDGSSEEQAALGCEGD